MTQVAHTFSPTRLGYARSASTGAFSTLLLFLLSWASVALALPFILSHSFVGLFTLEPAGSAASLGIGTLSSFLTGDWPRRLSLTATT